MALYWRYRKSSGEIDGISEDDVWSSDDFFGVLTDPSAPDGISFEPQKVWTGSVVRNATAPEIAGFAAYRATDENLIQRSSAKSYLVSHPVTRKALRSLVKVIMDEINTLRSQHSFGDRTLAQALSAIEAEIDGGDQD